MGSVFFYMLLFSRRPKRSRVYALMRKKLMAVDGGMLFCGLSNSHTQFGVPWELLSTKFYHNNTLIINPVSLLSARPSFERQTVVKVWTQCNTVINTKLLKRHRLSAHQRMYKKTNFSNICLLNKRGQQIYFFTT